jgi:hypothetical protein
LNAQDRVDKKPTPHDSFTKECYRQPSLIEPEVYPEPYRNDGSYDIITCKTTGESTVLADFMHARQNRVGSISINVHEVTDEGEENQLILKQYWEDMILPLSVLPSSSHGSDDDGSEDERRPLRRKSSIKKKTGSITGGKGRISSSSKDKNDDFDVEDPPPARTRERR